MDLSATRSDPSVSHAPDPHVAALQEAAQDMLTAQRAASAEQAARFLKTLAHRDRLKVLCTLVEGEQPVSEIEARVGASQSAISQHLARMKEEGIVEARRAGRQVLYKIADPLALNVIGLLYERFCGPET
jgi:ArsR family transcriptional regulator